MYKPLTKFRFLTAAICCLSLGTVATDGAAVVMSSNGVVLDVTPPEEGNPAKVLYPPAQCDAIKSAGFQSVLFYVVAAKNPVDYEDMVRDA